MSDISQVHLPDGNDYNIKAAKADKAYVNVMDVSTYGYFPIVTVAPDVFSSQYTELKRPIYPPTVYNETGDMYINHVQVPHHYTNSEEFAGYWDATSPQYIVYEKTVVLSSAKTISAGNTSAAGAWTSVSTGWNNEIIVLDFQAYSYSGNDKTYWGHLTAQWNKTNKDIRVLNIRSQSFPIDAFTIKYYYPT